jgi:methylated-DNA-protein-cysteine methyltransferase-like protein
LDRDERRRRICAAIRDIPKGSVAAYGQIADIAGVPRGARQVGYTLRQLPDGHDVPWYRVVQAAGQIAFARDTSQFREQRARLIEEGVRVVNGRVDMRQFRWNPDLDELLWKPTSAWDDD